MKTTKTYLLTIEVDEEKAKKFYPNYRFGFSNVNQFIRFLLAEIPQKKMKYGYRITLKKQNNVNLGYPTRKGIFY